MKPQANDRFCCCVKIRGQLSQRWSDWFDGLVITCDNQGDTTLSGSLPDQAALHGLLNKIRDLGLVLQFFDCSPIYGDTNETSKTD